MDISKDREDDFVGEAGSHSYLELPQAVDSSWPTAKPAADCRLWMLQRWPRARDRGKGEGGWRLATWPDLIGL